MKIYAETWSNPDFLNSDSLQRESCLEPVATFHDLFDDSLLVITQLLKNEWGALEEMVNSIAALEIARQFPTFDHSIPNRQVVASPDP